MLTVRTINLSQCNRGELLLNIYRQTAKWKSRVKLSCAPIRTLCLHHRQYSAAMGSLPKDYFVKSLQYTRKTFQDVYPSIDPSSPTNSLSGKIAIVTGASRGIGARVRSQLVSHLNRPSYSYVLIHRESSPRWLKQEPTV